MSHSNTQRMIDYWGARRGECGAAARASIDPGEFANVASQAFIIGRPGAGSYPFRLAGEQVQELHGGPLRGLDFLSLWATADRARLQTMMEAALRRGEAMTIQAQGRALQGQQAKLEILLAPLTGSDGAVDRFLGFYQPVSPLFQLGDQPIARLYLLAVTGANETAPPLAPLRLAAVDGRRIA